jgi:hypothetical protein
VERIKENDEGTIKWRKEGWKEKRTTTQKKKKLTDLRGLVRLYTPFTDLPS